MAEVKENGYTVIERFNYGIERNVQRSGSYSNGYHFEYESYEFFEIIEELIPERIIPAHIEPRDKYINIDLDSVIDEEEEKRIAEKLEKERLEKEAANEKERLKNLYKMDRREIIEKATKSLQKKKEPITINNLRKEYFDIVVKGKLESQEWIDYYSNEFNKESDK
jgi:uncharacterized protein YueI